MSGFLPRRWLFADGSLVDHFQRVSLSRPHARGVEKRPHSAHIAPLPADDFAHVGFSNFKLDHIAVKMIDENLIRSVDHPLGDFLDENANSCGNFGHNVCLGYRSRRGRCGLGIKLADAL